MEQCTSDLVADYHASLVPPGLRIVDLTTGLGIDAFHLARKAKEVLCIEIDPMVAEAIEPNAKAMALNGVRALNLDCAEWLEHTEEHFDVAFIDPARRGAQGQRLFSLHDCKPGVTQLLPRMLEVADKVIIKMSPMLDITQVMRELPGVEEIHVIGTRSECKELVAVVRKQTDEPKVIVSTLDPLPFSSIPTGVETIGEPYPAVMKALPWVELSGEQIGPGTHLWRNPDEDFPGRIYELVRTEEFSSGNIKRLAREKLAASVAVKNLPIKAEELRKRLRTTENDTLRLVAAKCHNGNKLLFLRPLTEWTGSC